MLAHEIVAWLMILVFGVSLIYPWHPSWPGAKWLQNLPLTLIPLWIAYEAVMPSHLNIRLDLPFILWGLMVAYCVYVVGLMLFAYLRSRRHKDGASSA